MLWRGIPSFKVEGGEDWKEAQDKAISMDVVTWREVVGVTSPAVESEGLKVLEWGGMEVKA